MFEHYIHGDNPKQAAPDIQKTPLHALSMGALTDPDDCPNCKEHGGQWHSRSVHDDHRKRVEHAAEIGEQLDQEQAERNAERDRLFGATKMASNALRGPVMTKVQTNEDVTTPLPGSRN